MLLKIAEKFLKENEIILRIERAEQDHHGLAYYDPGTQAIYLLLEKIQDNAIKFKVDPQIFLTMVMSHEVGHYLDKKYVEITNKIGELYEAYKMSESNNELENLEKEIFELIKIKEINAWKNGRKFIHPDQEKEYDNLNIRSLEIRYLSTKNSFSEIRYANEKTKYIKENQELKEQIFQLSQKNNKLKIENVNLNGKIFELESNK